MNDNMKKAKIFSARFNESKHYLFQKSEPDDGQTLKVYNFTLKKDEIINRDELLGAKVIPLKDWNDKLMVRSDIYEKETRQAGECYFVVGMTYLHVWGNEVLRLERITDGILEFIRMGRPSENQGNGQGRPKPNIQPFKCLIPVSSCGTFLPGLSSPGHEMILVGQADDIQRMHVAH